eukprot:TRINITY_DN20285_c0_g5_i1.p1 TRINITY_DN20285_c0_g5~~TRINITY_DN20285_c0_g5_i1.p1  ORF type:complete len:728 (+),score=152.14 TRINITY_DN20285_c0_g5_i1:114-2297(+)
MAMAWLRNLCRSSARDAALDADVTATVCRVQRVETAGAVMEDTLTSDVAADIADSPLSGGLAASGAESERESDGECSEASALKEAISFFSRDGEELQVRRLMVDDECASIEALPRLAFPSPRVAAWSPDGTALAIADATGGLRVAGCLEAFNESNQHVLCASSTNVQKLQWSPLGKYLVAEGPSKGDAEPNVRAWKQILKDDGMGETFELATSLQNPKFERSHEVFKWTADERLCCQLLQDGAVQFVQGSDLGGPVLRTLPLPRAAQAVEFAPCGTRAAVFLPDVRDMLQRVIAPAEVTIVDLCATEEADAAQIEPLTLSVKVEFGQQAELMWSPSSTALLAHCQTHIDDSGQSYYGGSKLLLVSKDTSYTLDLTESKDSDNSAVTAVAWSPRQDEFVLIQGFQPAKVTLWAWDEDAQKCSMVRVLREKAHRNTIRWNAFGSLACIAGFGNLAGEVDFFGRAGGTGLSHIASCQAPCTVSAEWAPDNRHIMMACLAPRMRVDNGLSIWCALTGSKVAELSFDQLLEVQWSPEPNNGTPRFSDVSVAEIEHALSGARARLTPSNRDKAANAAREKKAYVPPSARGGGKDSGDRVARMMRGESCNTEVVDPIMLALRKSSAEARDRSQAEQTPPQTEGPKMRKEAQASQRAGLTHGNKQPCPTTGWEYTDPKGNKQGPFTLEQMQSWHKRGLFKPTLLMRCNPEDRFVPLGELFPHPMVPFLRAPKRPQ